MQQLTEHIFMTEIPLKGSPLKWINSYLIKGERSLVVDTAFNTPECEAALMGSLAQQGLSVEDTDFFITHLHVDHSGLAAKVRRDSNKVYASAEDAARINAFNRPDHRGLVEHTNGWAGTPKEDALGFDEHVAHRFRPEREIEFDIVAPGDILEAGGMRWEVLELCGHTPGQVGLYCREEDMLFCGDNVLDKITPNISSWDLERDYLARYLENLSMIRSLGLKRLFTAHRELPTDIDGRIGELLLHHERRLCEVRDILTKRGDWMIPYDIASRMTWSYKQGFESFPKMQKWFACSEAIAHLEYLRHHGEVKRRGEAPLEYHLI